MRNYLYFFVILLVGCGSDLGDSPARHTPQIADLTMSPAAVTYMEGGGTVVLTAEMSFTDTGRDIQTLWVRMPDGTTVEFDTPAATETGTVTQDIVMSTERLGAFHFDLWLVDKAGYTSVYHSAEFKVVLGPQNFVWTNRLIGLPNSLNDVVWDGSVFVAVGHNGVVLTSADGIDWVARESGTEATLNAVAAYESDIIAVGDEIVLLSTDHGETWIEKAGPAGIDMGDVAVSPSQLIVMGMNLFELHVPIVMVSEDRGDTWQAIDSLLAANMLFTDIIYRNGLFVATAGTFFLANAEGRVLVSADGTVWDEIIHDQESNLNAVAHDGERFIVAGDNGAVLVSPDGFNWTEIETPVDELDYLSAAGSGSKLVLAGGYFCRDLYGCSSPQIGLLSGIISTDGGLSWDLFIIDGEYLSYGLAFGNGRFVSVGDDAIYTAE